MPNKKRTIKMMHKAVHGAVFVVDKNGENY